MLLKVLRCSKQLFLYESTYLLNFKAAGHHQTCDKFSACFKRYWVYPLFGLFCYKSNIILSACKQAVLCYEFVTSSRSNSGLVNGFSCLSWYLKRTADNLVAAFLLFSFCSFFIFFKKYCFESTSQCSLQKNSYRS